MKKIVFGLMIFISTFLFATDVSNFDIKGIKLGMSKDEVLNIFKNMQCSIKKDWENPNMDHTKPPRSIFYKCEQGKNYITIKLNHNNKVIYIHRYMYNKTGFNITSIKNQILLKYGKTKFVKKISPEYGSSYYSICYGNCINKKNDEYVTYKGIGLNIVIFKDVINFNLENMKLEKENKIYYKDNIINKVNKGKFKIDL